MERRSFIKRTGLVIGAATIAPKLISAQKSTTRIVVLHTNDTHSNIDPFPKNHPKYADLGGVSRRAHLVKKIREEEPHVLLLDAGDIFQGTPYFNKFRGEIEMKTMQAMGYDVVTLGNHDFDIGMEGYKNAYTHAQFKVVNANYQLENTPLSALVTPHTIVKKGGVKIGIFGVGINLQGLVPEANWKGLNYLDPIAVAQEQANLLRNKGCDLVLCLSHLGYAYNTDQVSDKVLATKTSGIDAIIGGHTHTFLSEAEKCINSTGKEVYINQVGYGGLKLGRMDFEFGKGSNDSYELQSYNSFVDEVSDKA